MLLKQSFARSMASSSNLTRNSRGCTGSTLSKLPINMANQILLKRPRNDSRIVPMNSRGPVLVRTKQRAQLLSMRFAISLMLLPRWSHENQSERSRLIWWHATFTTSIATSGSGLVFLAAQRSWKRSFEVAATT